MDSRDRLYTKEGDDEEALAQDSPRTSIASHSSRPLLYTSKSATTSSAMPASKLLLPAQIALIVLSAVSSRETDQIADIEPGPLILLPTAQYAVLSGCVGLWTFRAKRHARAMELRSPSASPGPTDPPQSQGRGANVAEQRHRAWAAGAALAVAEMVKTAQLLTNGPSRLANTLEIFTIAALIVALLLSPSSWLHPTQWKTIPSTRPVVLIAGLSFLLAFGLIGLPAMSATYANGLLRATLIGASTAFVKDGLCDEGSAVRFAQNAVLSALGVSLIGLLPLRRLAGETIGPLNLPVIARPLFVASAAQIMFYAVLHASTSAMTPLLAVFPRNFALLVWPSMRPAETSWSQRWTQLFVIYAIGAVLTFRIDGDLRSAFPCGRRKASAGSIDEEEDALALVDSTGAAPRTARSPPLHRHREAESADEASAGVSLRSRLILSLLPFLPLLLGAAVSPLSSRSFNASCAYLPDSIRSTVCPFFTPTVASSTVDIVMAYYDEGLPEAQNLLTRLRQTPYIAARQERVVVYNKGSKSEQEIREGMALAEKDEVVPLPNLGREGGTYLSHILLHYNATVSSLAEGRFITPAPTGDLAEASKQLRRRTIADMTYFFQPHMAWGFVVEPRIQHVVDKTGFANFGPNIRLECSYDTEAPVDISMVEDLYNIFRGKMCRKEEGQLGGWSAQMAVSRRRILDNPYARYAYVSDLLSAPAGHWIHDQWGPNDSGGPSNPAFGHAVERAWPAIFGCEDVQIVKECPNEESAPEKCQCFDE